MTLQTSGASGGGGYIYANGGSIYLNNALTWSAATTLTLIADAYFSMNSANSA